MILVLGLLTLLAVAHTEAGHVKGRPPVDWTQEKLHQDDIPSPQISVAPAQDAVEGWIHDPKDALEDHARIKTASKAGSAVDALHHASGEHRGKAQTAPTQVKTIVGPATTDAAANNPAAVKTVVKKTQIYTQGVNNPTTTIISRQSVPITRSQYKVKTIQRTSTPIIDSDSVLKFVPGSPGSPVLIPGQLNIPKEIGPLGLGPYSAEFGQRTRVLTSGPSSEFSIDTSRPPVVANQPLIRARGEAQRQAAVTTAQNLDVPGPSLTASSPGDSLNQPLVYAPPSADITPEMIAAIEGEIGARIVTGRIPGTVISQGGTPLSRIPTGLLDVNQNNLPERKLKIETPTVQNVDYRKDSVILRPQTQGSSGVAPAGNIQSYTGAGRRPPAPILQSPVQTSLPVRKYTAYETVRRTPISSVVPSRASFDAPVSPLGENVPISGVDGNVFGRVGQIFEMSPGGKLTPVSDSKPDTDKYVKTLKEKIRSGNQRTQTVVSTVKKPEVSPQISLSTGGSPRQPLNNVPISGLDGNVQGQVGQIFEISDDGKLVPVLDSPAPVPPAAVVTSPRKPAEVKPAPQPPLSVASLPSPRPQATPISRGSSIVPPRTSLLSQNFGTRTSSYLPLNVVQRTGSEFPNVPRGYQTFSGIQSVGFARIPGEGLTGIELSSFPGIEDALTEGIISNELLAQIPSRSLATPPGFQNVLPFGTIPSPIQPIPGFISGTRSTQILSAGASPFQGTLQEIVAPGSLPKDPLPFQIASFQNRAPQNLPLPLQIPFGTRSQAISPGRSPQVIDDRTLQAPRRDPPATSGRTDLRSSPRRTPQIPTQVVTPQKPSTTIQKPSLPRTTPQRPLPPSRISQTTSSNVTPVPPSIRRTPQVPPASSRVPQTQTTPSRILQTTTTSRRTGTSNVGRIPQKPISVQRTTSLSGTRQLPPFRDTISRIEQSVFQGAPQSTTGGLRVDFSQDKVPISGVDGNIYGNVGQIFEVSSDGNLVPVTDSQALPEKPKPAPPSRRIITATSTRISQPSPQIAPRPQIVLQGAPQSPTGGLGVDFSQDKVPISGVDGNIFGHVGQIFEVSSDGKLVPATDSQALTDKPKPATPSRRISTATGTRISQPSPQIAPRPQIVLQGAPQSTTGGLGVDFSQDKVPISGVDGNIFGHVGQIFEVSSDGKLVPATDSQALTDKPKPATPSRRIITATSTRISQPSPQIAPKPQISRTTIQSPKTTILTAQRTETRTNVEQTIPTAGATRSGTAPGNIQSLLGGISSQRSTGPQTIRNDEQIQLKVDEEITDHLLKPTASFQLDPAIQMTGPKSTFHRTEEASPQVISITQGGLKDDLQQQQVHSTGFSQVPPHSVSASQIPLLTRVNETPDSQEQVLEQVLL
ncbi:mucin-2-like [Uloborus diversus]|uniref:mucin-2-like n=1 Tax=Uloborus diversus TaxID=327109 RepID=UPI0024095F07|nr:mucin-2-like [Uloborus diversus]